MYSIYQNKIFLTGRKNFRFNNYGKIFSKFIKQGWKKKMSLSFFTFYNFKSFFLNTDNNKVMIVRSYLFSVFSIKSCN